MSRAIRICFNVVCSVGSSVSGNCTIARATASLRDAPQRSAGTPAALGDINPIPAECDRSSGTTRTSSTPAPSLTPGSIAGGGSEILSDSQSIADIGSSDWAKAPLAAAIQPRKASETYLLNIKLDGFEHIGLFRGQIAKISKAQNRRSQHDNKYK